MHPICQREDTTTSQAKGVALGRLMVGFGHSMLSKAPKGATHKNHTCSPGKRVSLSAHVPVSGVGPGTTA